MATPLSSDPGVEHAAAVDFEYDTERRARAVAESIAVEVGEIDDARSGVDVDRDGRVVRVDVTAADLVALRAGLNTWLRLVAVAEEVIGVGGDSPPAITSHADTTDDSRNDERPGNEPVESGASGRETSGPQ